MLKEEIRPRDDNIRAILEFPMPQTYTEIRAFCGLLGHYRHFIRNFTHLAHTLYDLLGDEIKMGPVTLTPEAIGGGMRIERKDHIGTSIGVPRLREAFPVGKRCIQRKTGSGVIPEAGRRTLPPCSVWQQNVDIV